MLPDSIHIISNDPQVKEEMYSLGISYFSSALHSGLIFTELDKCGCESCPVRDTCEQQFHGLVELIIEALLADF